MHDHDVGSVFSFWFSGESGCEAAVSGGPCGPIATPSASTRYIQPAQAIGAGLLLVLVLVLKVLLLAITPGLWGAGWGRGAGWHRGPGAGVRSPEPPAPDTGLAATARGDAVAAVLLEVSVQVVRADEGLAAAVALVGPQASVHTHVVFQVVVMGEGRPALLAQVRLLTCVLPHVHLELVLPVDGARVSGRWARPPPGTALRPLLALRLKP